MRALFTLQARAEGEEWSDLASLDPALTSYTDVEAARGSRREYRLRAVNDFGDSAWVEAASPLAIPYLISFESEGGSPVPPAETEADLSVAIPTSTRQGYSFAGWFTGAGGKGERLAATTAHKASAAYHAAWTPISYPIEYCMWSGVGKPSNPSSYTVETTPIILADPVYAGYSFLGWYTDSSFPAASKLTRIAAGATGKVTLYAKFEIITYTATLEILAVDVNMQFDRIQFTIDSSICMFRDPGRAIESIGYNFLGWYTELDALNPYGKRQRVTQIPTGSIGDRILYAGLQKYTPQIYFDHVLKFWEKPDERAICKFGYPSWLQQKEIEVVIPAYIDGLPVTYIDINTFVEEPLPSDCMRAISVDIPNTVTQISPGAFNGCAKLSEAHVRASAVPRIVHYLDSEWAPSDPYSSCFVNCAANLVVYVPQESLELYKADPCWKKYNLMGE